ncbi:23S rRNA methyltransferase [Sulfurifustis variabilis]|uniref:23S rRNA (uracil(1939)-C(5))-methyltransferase RlmD n=1 Tax=Sulfurifustis variabilis TaxID=1675686 RepID=A0A1B4VBR3_9GAMM|nr:23S rRNA (uracil(1939)-C(5))-methyltransferase RlmD [Sulfurifustis variabilis]BAU48261.1 23S rRNA methyltransferase [Sulfurifustis variabilis]
MMHAAFPGTETTGPAQARRGEEAEARIESLDYEGRGVARIDGKATFIDGALPGERVRFRYHRKRRRHDEGSVIEVIEQSPDRVAPPCRHFGRCGGCSLQHLAPPAQIAAKQRVLAENLRRIGRVAPERWLPPILGPDRGYRRRARLGVRDVPKKGGVLVGFREKRRSYITPLDDCLTLDRRVAVLLPALRELVAGLSRPDRLPQIEASAGDEAVALVFRHLEPLTEADLRRLRAFGEAHDVQVHLQPDTPDSVRALWPDPAPELGYALPEFEVRLVFRPTDFVQVNAEVNRRLVHQAMELLAIAPDDAVLDLFCGLGNFTLAAGRQAKRVLGIEAEPRLIARARANAERNGLTNVEFRTADLAGLLDPAPWEGFRFERLLLDPPRTGAIEAIRALPADGARRIVYVSCNPATLARDSQYLVEVLGYRLSAAGVADMFPHTAHVESLALFVK